MRSQVCARFFLLLAGLSFTDENQAVSQKSRNEEGATFTWRGLLLRIYVCALWRRFENKSECFMGEIEEINSQTCFVPEEEADQFISLTKAIATHLCECY